MAEQIPKPVSLSEVDRELLLDALANMDVVKVDGKAVQGLINRRSREKDNAENINPAFPAEVSPDADLSQIQKRAALNLLIREESSGGQNLGLEAAGNTVGRYHIQQNKAALVNPEIKNMTTSEYHTYILNNPEAEEQIVSKYIDIEIDKLLKNSGVDKSRLRHNEYASIVSNLYNMGNQPKLLKSVATLTSFRKDNRKDKRFTEKPYFEELKGKSQNLNQTGPIADTGADLPPDTQNTLAPPTAFPPERVTDVQAKENKYEGVPFLRYKPVQKFVKKLGVELAEGGVVPMERQMEMFQEGGLRDEGGTVDPVSGNEVPPGSTQEEVRDDIPAQLSEGEFVFPADVVRYIGLGNLMQMRQEAKMGLKMMDEMGQMGNSEEATIPDDLPFNVNDLELDDEPREMQVGGFITPTTAATQQQQQMGISGFQQAAAPTTGVAPIPQAASQQFVQPVRPQQAAVPTMQQYKPQEVPSFTQLIGENPGQYDELREYRNEAGEVRKIPFKAGQPIYPIPEGFTFVNPEDTQTETPTVATSRVETARVKEDKDDSQATTIAQAQQKSVDKILGPAKNTSFLLPTDKAEHDAAFGGHKTFGMQNSALNTAIKNQGLAQLGGLSALGAVASAAGISSGFTNSVAIAGVTAEEAALSFMGYSSRSQLRTSEQATTLGEAMTAAHKAAQEGKNVNSAIRAVLNGTNAKEAQRVSITEALQKQGYTSDNINNAEILNRASNGYAALASDYENDAKEIRQGGTVRDSDGNPVKDNDGDEVLTGTARAQSNALMEMAKSARAKARVLEEADAIKAARDKQVKDIVRSQKAEAAVYRDQGIPSPQAKPQDYSGFSPGKSDSGGGGGGGGAPSGPGSADVGGQNRGFRAKGGLMQAPKLEAKKKMKRGGLASKK